jgi:hypothetical protein
MRAYREPLTAVVGGEREILGRITPCRTFAAGSGERAGREVFYGGGLR